MLEIGQLAPEIEAQIQTGEQIKLSNYRGKKVVLYFYPKDSTPGCTAQACDLRDNHHTLLAQGYVVLGVSADSIKSHTKFIEKHELPFDLISDESLQVVNDYGVWVEKNMYGRNYMGIARTTFLIDENGVITDIIKKVKTKAHSSQFLEIES